MSVCILAEDGYCQRHRTRHAGRLKELALDPGEKGESYRVMWDGLVAKQPSTPAPSPPPKSPCACVHFGAPTGATVGCESCEEKRKGTKIKTFACDIYGVCTVDRLSKDIACCHPKGGKPCADFMPRAGTPVPKKRALITLNIGNVLQPKSRASMQAAAKRWGADFLEITQPMEKVGGRPHWQKAFLARHAAKLGYAQCVYYDADVLIRDDCPNVIDLTPAGHVGIVANDQIDGVLWQPGPRNRYYGAIAWWAAKLGKPVPPLHAHCNSGMIVFEPGTHAPLFDAWAAAGRSVGWGAPTKLIDQAAFTVLLAAMQTDASRTWLPMMYNTLIYRHELIRADDLMQTFVYHYTGRRKDVLPRTEWRHGVKPLVASALPRAIAPPVKRRTPSAVRLGDIDPAKLFDRAICVNLDRRTDRWQALNAGLPQPWPFAPVQRLSAIDVKRCPPPAWFAHEAGQWGAVRSHLRAIEDSLNDGVHSLLVLEDDAEFCPGFLEQFHRFITDVPADWEMLFLGGSHTRGQRQAINAHVEIPAYITLAHAYALRGEGLRKAYDALNQYTPKRAEIDHRLGALSASGQIAVYAPRSWLVYQAAGYSDLLGKNLPLRGVGASERAGVAGRGKR